MVLNRQIFESLPDGQVFATGVLPNSPEGLFMTRNGGTLRWVAKKGWGYDWAIYCHWADKSPEWVRDHGDKVTNEAHIKRCVECDDETFKIYRY